VPTPLMASYGATKHAVVALSTSLSIEAAAAGIRVSVICPGVIRTPLLTGGRYGNRPIPRRREVLRRRFARALELTRPPADPN